MTYKDAEGNVLKVMESRDHGYHLGWWIKEDQSYGALLGEGFPLPDRNRGKAEWEECVCYETAKPFASGGGEGVAFRFENQTKARKALKAVVAALVSGEAPWPEWAIKAKEEGWTPPKGWKP